MANIIIGAITVAMILLGSVTLLSASLNAAAELSLTWDEVTKRKGDKSRTEITLITADISGSGTDIDISIRNSGQSALVGFSDWDAVIRYYDTTNNTGLNIKWLEYATSSPPSANQWEVEGIYTDAGTKDEEIFEPNIFNPGEEMIVKVNITPAIPVNTDNVVTIGAENGMSLSAPFSR
ncbi:MAG: hypothetical protein IIC21_00875 [Chloroflexi bacterium]|nr:hypothetical protein [Chloroflexota bacterium]